ncbi:MAG TPA: methionine adenosyltransferase [Polyangiaceae bacterium]|nr:methionine adenosyltransferase [Polyangiaceae bacterium]
MDLLVRPLGPVDGTVEIVEHKGIGHPDTMCDALAEAFGVALARDYRERFGRVLHFNVDKALLIGGEARAAFGGGEVVAPIRVILAGRATRCAGGVVVPVDEIARASAKTWLREHLHALDADRDVVIDCLARGGSADLVELFGSAERVPLANDTSIGVGHAPASLLERVVLAVAERLRAMARERPFVGEDVKVMGLRRYERIELTIACAVVGRHTASLADYVAHREELEGEAARVARSEAGRDVEIQVNAADDLAAERVYLTVTGTSAEAGDDGEVGRGNRVGGLITPYRPMSLEAAAGKNPVSHVGKLYNVTAQRIAARIIESVPDVAEAECVMLSRIGRRIDDPVVVDVTMRTRDGTDPGVFRGLVAGVVGEGLSGLAALTREMLEGRVQVY